MLICHFKFSGMPRLNSFQRTNIVVLRELKFSYGNIAKKVGCSKSSAERVYKKFQKENTIDDLARPGRPRICSPQDERLIYRTSMNNNCWLTTPKIDNFELLSQCNFRESADLSLFALLFSRLQRRSQT